MKRLVVILFSLALLVSFAVSAQTPAPTPTPVAKLNTMEAYVFGGQVATAAAGNLLTYKVDFQTNVGAGFRWFPSPKFALDFNYTHDNVRIGYWLVRHDFIQAQPVEGFEYSAIQANFQWWPVRGDSGGLYLFVGPDYFLGTGEQASKLGFAAGFGGQYAIGNFFVEGTAEYWHVQDFLVPVANTYVGRLAFGYKF